MLLCSASHTYDMKLKYTLSFNIHCTARANRFVCADEMFMFMYWSTNRPLRLKVVIFFAVVTDVVPSLIRM